MDWSKVQFSGYNVDEAKNSKNFRDWQENLDPRFRVESIHFQSVDIFGDTVKFIKFVANVYDENGNFIPGIVFMRGGCVAILEIIEALPTPQSECGDLYIVLCRQPRFPVGNFEFPEIPAGMLDGSGNFAGVAAKELQEECGLSINDNELFDLTELWYTDKWPGIYPSPGGCDEFIHIFLHHTYMKEQDVEKLQGQLHGNREEGEQIRLSVVPLEEIMNLTPDGKSIAAFAMYLGAILHDDYSIKIDDYEEMRLQQFTESQRD